MTLARFLSARLFAPSAFALTLCAISSSGFAQAQQPDAKTKAAAAAPAGAVPGVRGEFLNELKIQEGKFVQLAQAIPADKYTWRPAEGVRSISEVFLHVSAANYNLPRNFGVQPPADFKVQGFDKSTTDKNKVIQTLKDSYAHLRQAVLDMPDSAVETQLDWFGAKSTYRGVFFFILRHAAEHLGQSIAYARVNGVVPPWTAESQQPKPRP